METRKSLVDTSAWIEALRVYGDRGVRARVEELTVEGHAVLCDFVRLELWNGARGEAEHRMLMDLQSELECVPTSREVWGLAFDLARKCRKVGVTVPSTDILIFACARYHGLDLVHMDNHFEQIRSIVGDQPQ